LREVSAASGIGPLKLKEKTMSIRNLLFSSLLVSTAALAAANAPEEIPLWANGAPGSEGKTAPEAVTTTDGVHRVSSIHNPSIAVHLPSMESATGAAVIILPGGGHRYLSIDNEGHAVAKWLGEHGVAGFVLKYRLAREAGSTYRVDVHALQDAQRALRLVRRRAREWNVDPERIGIMGFSAGGELAILAAARFDPGKADASDPVERESSRPAFQALIYPGSLKADLELPKDAPPAFLCTAFDDRGPSGVAVNLFQKLRDAGVNAEIHIYSKGGHGFGMRDRPLPITSWPVRLHEWMGDQGLLKSRVSASR
jgi:acetyl esterase/lipase